MVRGVGRGPGLLPSCHSEAGSVQGTQSRVSSLPVTDVASGRGGGEESWPPPLLTCLQGFQGHVQVVPTRPSFWVPGKHTIPLHTPGRAPPASLSWGWSSLILETPPCTAQAGGKNFSLLLCSPPRLRPSQSSCLCPHSWSLPSGLSPSGWAGLGSPPASCCSLDHWLSAGAGP